MSAPDTRSEYEKPLEYPLCAKCGRELVRCGHHWAYTLPRGEHQAITGAERSARDRLFEREKARAESLIAEGRMSPEMLRTLGFEARVKQLETLVDEIRARVAPSTQPALFDAAPATTPSIAPLLIVLDTETSGRGPQHQPIEIAAKAINNDGTAVQPARCFWARLRLFEGVRLDPTALAVHGLDCESPEWNRTALDPVEGLRRFAAWWPAGALLVAHNATFDVGMLTSAFARAGLPCPAWAPAGRRPLCTLQLARRNGYKPAGLSDLCSRFGVSNEGAHGARADVNRLIAIWPHLQRSAA